MPIGERSVIEHCPPKRVRDFLDAWYHPGRMAIIVVGDFAEPAPDVAAKVPPAGARRSLSKLAVLFISGALSAECTF